MNFFSFLYSDQNEITIKKYSTSSDAFVGISCSSLKHIDHYYLRCSDLNNTISKITLVIIFNKYKIICIIFF